jgi:DNA-binding MarR family transcriptional regulator
LTVTTMQMHGLRMAAEQAGLEADRGAARDDGLTLGEIGLDAFAPHLMNRIMGLWNAGIAESLRARGLTTAQMRALAVLSVRPRPSIHELALYTVLEPSTMSRTLDALEARGLIRRDARAGDGRAREIALTQAGAAIFAQFWPVMRASHDRLFEEVDASERDAFVATLRKLLRVAGRDLRDSG